MSLASNISTLATRVGTEFKTLRTSLTGNSTGSLAALETTAKGNLVVAINEVNALAEGAAGGGATINDVTPSTETVYSSSRTEARIDERVTTLTGTAPANLDTLGELADALADDANFAATVTTTLATKAPLASPALTGTPTAPTAAANTSTTQLATTAFVQQETPNASATVVGMVELATDAEVATGTDTTRAVTPAGLRSVTGDPETNYVTVFEAGLV
jgi:hypothetical protein